MTVRVEIDVYEIDGNEPKPPADVAVVLSAGQYSGRLRLVLDGKTYTLNRHDLIDAAHKTRIG